MDHFDEVGSLKLIYKPSSNKAPDNTPTVYVKFSNNIYIDEVFLNQFNISYTDDDLEDTPLGKRFVIRRD